MNTVLPSNSTLQHGKYRLEGILGRGGFGITYKGTLFEKVKLSLGDTMAEIPVAIKEFFFQEYCTREENTSLVSATSTSGKAMFEQFKQKLIKEAHILSSLNHPNILRVLEVFEENNTAYMVVKYIAGQTLKEKVEKEGVLAPTEALTIMHLIGQALTHVHDQKILHLDVKPSNIILDPSGTPFLIDFGVSKRYDATNHQQTSTTPIAYSKGFAPIEQVLQVDLQQFLPQSDVYGLGATLYYLLCGVAPKDASLRVLEHNTNYRVQWPDGFRCPLSVRQEEVLMKALALKWQDRYDSVSQFIKALESDGDTVIEKADVPDTELDKPDEPKPAPVPKPAPPVKKASPISRPAKIGIGVGLAAVAIALIVWLQPSGEEREWRKVLTNGDSYNYQEFMMQYPNSLHRQEAVDSAVSKLCQYKYYVVDSLRLTGEYLIRDGRPADGIPFLTKALDEMVLFTAGDSEAAPEINQKWASRFQAVRDSILNLCLRKRADYASDRQLDPSNSEVYDNATRLIDEVLENHLEAKEL